MSWCTALRFALRGLARHKLRTALTMLGIVIGVAAVVTMLAIATGARNKVQARITSYGTNLLYVYSTGGVSSGPRRRDAFTLEDVTAIRNECPAVQAAMPMIYDDATVIHGNHNRPTTVMGITPDFAVIRAWPEAHGRFLSEEDVRFSERVCLLGATLSNELFEGADPIGGTVRIHNIPFTVVGIMALKGEHGWGGDDAAFVPVTTVMTRLGSGRWFYSIQASARSPELSETAKDQIVALLHQRRHIKEGQKNDFDVHTQAQWLKSADESYHIFTILVASVASISLLVGGIGIMNIMLVSLTERVREIGIHQSLGARGRDILMWFVTESLILTMAGGGLGVGAGIGAARLLAKYASWDTEITRTSIVLAFSFAVAIGLFFGIYPAVKASKLDPVEALRLE